MSKSDRSSKQRQGESSIIDGFIRRAPRSSNQAPGGTPFEKPKHSASRQAVRIDDFNRPDGFSDRTREGNPQLPDGTGLGRNPKRSGYTGKSDMEPNSKKRRRKDKKSPGRAKRALKRSTSSIFMLVIFLAGLLLGTVYLRLGGIFQGGSTALALNDQIDPSQLHGEGDGRVNILILGKGGVGHTAPDLTDTIILASIDPIQKDVGMVSIPRDLWVQDASGGGTKINAVYSLAKDYAISQGKSQREAEAAGLDAIEKVIEQVTGLPVHYHIMVDFFAFQKAINIVDGVDIDVKTAVYENMEIDGKPYTLNVPVGRQHFDGLKALMYSRSRHTSARGDFDRSQRQREMIVALKEKVFSIGTFGNPIKMTQLLSTFGSHVRTNLNINDLMKLYGLAGGIDSSQVKSVGLADPPNSYVTTSMIEGQSVVIPVAGLFNYDSIHYFLRNKFKDGFIRQENPTILVLNGTSTPGLANVQRHVLQSYGYHVIGTGDAPSKNYATSKLIDLRNGEKKYTKRYLELRYHTTATTSLPKGIDPGKADFVIIVGQDESLNQNPL